MPIPPRGSGGSVDKATSGSHLASEKKNLFHLFPLPQRFTSTVIMWSLCPSLALALCVCVCVCVCAPCSESCFWIRSLASRTPVCIQPLGHHPLLHRLDQATRIVAATAAVASIVDRGRRTLRLHHPGGPFGGRGEIRRGFPLWPTRQSCGRDGDGVWGLTGHSRTGAKSGAATVAVLVTEDESARRHDGTTDSFLRCRHRDGGCDPG